MNNSEHTNKDGACNSQNFIRGAYFGSAVVIMAYFAYKFL